MAIDLVTGDGRTLPLAPAPYHVTTVTGGGIVYVSSRADNRVWVIDPKSFSVKGVVEIGGIGHQMVVAVR